MARRQSHCTQSAADAGKDTNAPLASPLPKHGSCFVCGTDNEKGMGVVWCVYKTPTPQEDENPLPPFDKPRAAPGAVRIFADFEFDEAQQGPPGHAHGGASAAVVDEAMGAAVWQSGLQALLANLNLDYRLPVPLYTPLRAEAELQKLEGRKAYAIGRILVGGKVAVEATGLYVHIPTFFGDHNQFPDATE